jgi:hypothetical protein
LIENCRFAGLQKLCKLQNRLALYETDGGELSNLLPAMADSAVILTIKCGGNEVIHGQYIHKNMSFLNGTLL